MRRRGWLVAAAMATLPLGACSACSPAAPATPVDAGPTGSTRRDAGNPDTDAGAAPLPDADFDAGFDPFVGTWGPMPGASCVRMDYEPAKDITPFTWDACASARPGCGRLKINWTSQPGQQLTFHTHPVRTFSTGTFIAYERRFPRLGNPNFTAASITVVSDMQGHASFAAGEFEEDLSACTSVAAVSASHTMLLAGSKVDVDSGDMFGIAPYSDPTQAIAHWKTQQDLGVATGPSGGAVQRFVASGTDVVAETSDPFSLVIYDPLKDLLTLVKEGQGRSPAVDPVGVQGGVFALDSSNTRGLYYVALDGSSSKVYVPGGGDHTFSLDADDTSGDSLVWLQGQETGFDYLNVGLWTAPFATTSGAFAPHRVTGIPSMYNYGSFMVANAGMALLVSSATTAELVRLSDGWAWSIPAEAGEVFNRALWVDDQEVWLAVGFREVRRLQRQQHPEALPRRPRRADDWAQSIATGTLVGRRGALRLSALTALAVASAGWSVACNGGSSDCPHPDTVQYSCKPLGDAGAGSDAGACRGGPSYGLSYTPDPAASFPVGCGATLPACVPAYPGQVQTCTCLKSFTDAGPEWWCGS